MAYDVILPRNNPSTDCLLDTQDRVLGTEQEKHGDGCGVRQAPVPDAVYKETNTRKELPGAW